MHERALVKSLLDLVSLELNTRSLGTVREIEVEIGEFSGVEPALVATAFDELAPQYWSNQVRLEVRVASLMVSCVQCDHTFHVQQFQFLCPACKAGDVQVISGEEIRLMNIVAERQPHAEKLPHDQ